MRIIVNLRDANTRSVYTECDRESGWSALILIKQTKSRVPHSLSRFE